MILLLVGVFLLGILTGALLLFFVLKYLQKRMLKKAISQMSQVEGLGQMFEQLIATAGKK